MEQKNNKIAILGGSGKIGQYLVRHLLKHKHPLKVLVRNPENFNIEDPLLEVVKGDALNYETVESLVSGTGAVISAIGSRKGEPVVAAASTENVIKAMTANNIRRYIAITGLTINTPKDKKKFSTRFRSGLMRMLFSGVINDKQKAYELLTKSDLDWTVVRLPLVEFTGTRTFVRVGLEDCPGEKISSTDVAFFVGDQLIDEKYYKEAPFISNR